MRDKNFWFLRLDKMLLKENNQEIDTLNIETPYIYTMHGICSELSEQELMEQYFKVKNFDEIKQKYSKKECLSMLLQIKEELVKKGVLNPNAPSKKTCLFSILYFIYNMKIGDIVFVRTSNNDIYIVKIIGDAQLNNDDNYMHLKREVKVLHKFTYAELTQKVVCAKNRLKIRNTFQRVARESDYNELQNFLVSLNLLYS